MADLQPVRGTHDILADDFRLRGKGELVHVKIDPSLLEDDAEVIEDLVKAAHGDARKRLDEQVEKAMKEATAGMGGMLPGFKMPF